MKKVLASLLIVCTLLACVMITASAIDYKQGEEVSANWPGAPTFYFEPTDITGCTAIRFDLYVDDAAGFHFDSLEFGSSHNNDWKELNFNNNAGLGEISNGWNTVTFVLANKSGATDHEPSKDSNPAGWDPTIFQRIRLYDVDPVDSRSQTIKIRNIVGVKDDGTTVPCGAAAPAVVPTIKVLSAEWTGEHDWTITFKATGLDHPDFKGDAWVGVYPATHTSDSYSSADSMQTWRYLNEGRSPADAPLNVDADNTMTVTYTFETNLGNADGCAPKEGVDYDLVLFFNDSGYDYVCRDGFRFNDDTPADPTPDDPAPATFDAVSSVAALAVAALGVALVASKKRH